MPRLQFFLCSGVCMLNAAATHAQFLPRNPTIQQVVGYHNREQQLWEMKQVPLNTVFYRYHSRFTAWQHIDKSVNPLLKGLNIFISPGSTQRSIMMSSPGSFLYRPAPFKRTWKDPLPNFGSELLREILAPPTKLKIAPRG